MPSDVATTALRDCDPSPGPIKGQSGVSPNQAKGVGTENIHDWLGAKPERVIFVKKRAALNGEYFVIFETKWEEISANLK